MSAAGRPLPGAGDAHCHFCFAENAVELAAASLLEKRPLLSATVTPHEYSEAVALLEGFPNIRVGLGLHPWWVADGRCGEEETALFESLAPDAEVIGEIGLDFGKQRESTKEVQLRAFERAVRSGLTGGKTATLHAVRSVDVVVDLLEDCGCVRDNRCILHWFSGTSDQLQRAVRAGFYFSVNARMLATKRGKAYAKAMPAERLLVETDWPGAPCGRAPYAEWIALLDEAYARLEEIRGPGAAELARAANERVLAGAGRKD